MDLVGFAMIAVGGGLVMVALAWAVTAWHRTRVVQQGASILDQNTLVMSRARDDRNEPVRLTRREEQSIVERA